jgi:type IV pilus assembly protein PilA
MLNRLRQRSQDEGGFTLIELLVVILIIGILAAIAIPSFLNQTSKAYDASAKELARTAETTAETYATDHNGSYEGMTAGEMQKYESTLKSCPNGENACFSSVTLVGSKGEGYEVTTEAYKTADKFTIKRTAAGEIVRTCSSTTTGCKGGTSSSW